MTQAISSPVDDPLIPAADMLFDGSSSREEFVRGGEGFSRLAVIGRAHLQPSDAFLDVGCGNGSIARALTTYLTAGGRYDGVDIHQESINWLRERYQPYPHFRFTHADIYNKMYNPEGRYAARDYRLPFSDATFDVTLLKSVFTHMLPGDLPNYLNELSRVLRPCGRAVTTYFLLNDESRRFIDAGKDKMGLKFLFEGDPLCRVGNPEMPEAVVAHDEERVRNWCGNAGFTLAEIAYGDWCGRRSLLGLQDMMILVRE